MPRDIYYLIQGVKISEDLAKEIITHVVTSHEYDDYLDSAIGYFEDKFDQDPYEDDCVELVEFIMENDMADDILGQIWESYKSPYDGAGWGFNHYVGKVVWDSDECLKGGPASLPIVDVNRCDMIGINHMVNSFKSSFPDYIQEMFPPTGFYWVMGTS